jgi:nucleotide-binding universal stress UspA family protein
LRRVQLGNHVEILRVAAEVGADLIVMGVHVALLDLMLFGSTTNRRCDARRPGVDAPK